MTPLCILYVVAKVSQEHTASIFMVQVLNSEDESSYVFPKR
jgi:hypothetical protein